MATSVTTTYVDGIALTTDASTSTIDLHVDDTEVRSWPTDGSSIDNYDINGKSSAEYTLNGLAIRKTSAPEMQPMAPTTVTGEYTYDPPAALTKTYNREPIIMLGVAVAAILFVIIMSTYRGRSRFLVGLQQSMGVIRNDSVAPSPDSFAARKIRKLPLMLLGAGGAIVYILAAMRQKYPNTIRIGNEAGASNSDLGGGYGWRAALASAYLPFAKLGLFNIGTDEATAISTWCEHGTIPVPSDLEFIHNAVVDSEMNPSQIYKCLRCNYTPSDPTSISSGACDCASLSSRSDSSGLDKLLGAVSFINQYVVPLVMLAVIIP